MTNAATTPRVLLRPGNGGILARMTSTSEYFCEGCGYQYPIEQGRDVSTERSSCPECGEHGRAVRVKPSGPVTAVAEGGNPKGDPDEASS